MKIGDNVWDRKEHAWTWRNPASHDPNPTEPATPLQKSTPVRVRIERPCVDCNMECPGSYCPDVRYESVVEALPELSGLRRTGHDFGCGVFWYHLEPRVLEPHLVASRTVRCNCTPDSVVCWIESFRSVYESDPVRSIEISDSVKVEEALEIIELFRARKVADAPENLFEPATLSGIYRNGPDFELALANCGHNALVRLERTPQGPSLRYLKGVHGGGCV